MIFSVESIKRWLASMKASSRRRKAKARRQPTTLQIENLEPRHLMAVDQTVDDAQAAFSLVGDWTTVSDSSAVGTAYHQFAGGAGSSGSATWTFSDLEVGKHYEFLTTWADDATGTAAYSILDGGSVDAAKALDQSKDVLPAAAGETGWRSLGVVTADSTTMTVQLAGDEGVTADAVRVVEVGANLLVGFEAGARSEYSWASAADGTTVAVWLESPDYYYSPQQSALRVQRFDAAGDEMGPAVLVAVGERADLAFASIAMWSDHSFAVAWRADGQIVTRRFDAAGVAVSDQEVVAVVSGNYTPKVAAASDGLLGVVWADAGQVLFRCVDTAGEAIDTPTVVTAIGGGSPNVVALSGGGFRVGWLDSSSGSGSTLLTRTLDSSGDPTSSIVNTDAWSGWLGSWRMQEDGTGFIVSWTMNLAGLQQYRRYDSAGAGIGSAVVLDSEYVPYGAFAPIVSVFDGGCLAAWVRSSSLDAHMAEVVYRAFDSAGAALGEVQVVGASSTGSFDSPYLTRTPDGVRLAWRALDVAAGKQGLYGLELDADGEVVGEETLLQGYRTGGQHAEVVQRPDGSYVVVWEARGVDDWNSEQVESISISEGAGASWGVIAQIVSASGVALSPAFVVNQYTTNDQFQPDVGVDAEGNFVVVWKSFRQFEAQGGVGDGSGLGSYGDWHVYGRRFDSFGVARSDEFEVSLGDSTKPDVAMTPDGGFVVAASRHYYSHSSGSGGGSGYYTYDRRGIFARQYDASGSFISEQQASTWGMDETGPQVTVDGTGRYFAAWTRSGGEVATALYSAAGALSATNENSFGGWNGASTALAASDDGRFVTAQFVDGDTIGVVAFDSNGTALSSPSRFDIGAGYLPYLGSLRAAATTDGGWVVAWSAQTAGGPPLLYARFLDFAGRPVGDEFQIGDAVDFGVVDAVLVDADGGLSVAWTSYSGDPAARGVHVLPLAGPTDWPTNFAPLASNYATSIWPGQTDVSVGLFGLFNDLEDSDSALTYSAGAAGGVGFSTVEIDPATGIAHLAKPADVYGLGWITIRATDTEGLYSDAKVSVDFVAPATADPPTLDLWSANGSENSSFDMWINASLVDQDGSETLQAVAVTGLPYGASLSVGQDYGDGVWWLPVESLGYVTFNPPSGFSGTFDLTVSATSVESENGDSATTTQTLSVTVYPYDDPTTFVADYTSLYVYEDSSQNLWGLSLQDQDGSNAVFQVSLNVDSGTLYLGTDSGLSFSTGAAWTAGQSLVFSGSFEAVNAALQSISFQTAPDQSSGYGMVHIAVQSSDAGWLGSSDVYLWISAVADAPILNASNASGTEGEAIPLSVYAAPGDADGSEYLSSLVFSGQPEGFGFSAGAASGAGYWAVPADQLAGLTLTTPVGWHGELNLGIYVYAYESYTGEAAWTSISMWVEILPAAFPTTLSTPAALAATEDMARPVTGVSLEDSDGAEGLFLVALSASHGTLSLTETTGLYITTGSPEGAAELVFSGSFGDVNAALATLMYFGGANDSGEDAIHVDVHALDAEGLPADAVGQADVAVSIAPTADAPTLTVEDAAGDEDTAITVTILPGLVDVDGSETLQNVLISVSQPGATLSAGASLGGGLWTLSAVQLEGLTFTPAADFHGTFDLTVKATAVESANDDAAYTSRTLTVVVAAVDDLTTLSAPASLSAVEDVSKAVAGLVLADVDAAEGIYKISLSVAHGTLSLGETSGLTFLEDTASGDAELVFSGNFVAVNAALAMLAYLGSANYSGEDAIHVEAMTLDEEGEEDVSLGEVDVAVTVAPVADAPVVSASSAGGDEDSAIAVTISAGLADADGSETLQDVLISGVPTGATLSAGTNLGDGTWKLTSAQLSGLKITPVANFSGSLELTVKATSAESTGGGTASTSKTFTVAVAPVDDATTLSAPATLTTSENVAAAVIGVQLADVDGTTSGYQVAVSANHGALSLGTATGLTFTTGSAAGGAELVFHGTFAAVNTALATLSYKGATGYYGADAIAVHAEEFGGGSAVIGEASIAVTVVDVIYPPTLTVAPASGLEDSAVPLSITLATGYTALCSIRLEGVPTGATLSAGTHETDGSWTLTPAQLTGLTLSLAANASGAFDLTVKAFDGSGAALVSTTKTLHVVVAAVNDAPTLSGFGLVESTGEPGALTATNAKVQGTVVDVEGKGFFYVDLDLDADGKVDQTFSTSPGAFEVDLASLLKAGATTVKARGSEYDAATGKTLAGAWQTLTFTYAPVANAAPTTIDLALAGTPIETGNVVHAAPLLQGKLTDGALAGAAYFAELDLNGDDAADLMSLAKADGTFSFNLNGLVDLGEQTVRVRGVEVDAQTFEYLYGEWASLKFTLAAEVNALPQISGLALVVDTDAADGVTSDPRITGTLTDPDSTGAGYYVEIDLGQDGVVDDTVQVKAGEAFTYDPTSRIAIGEVKLAVRGVEWKGNADPLRGAWSKFEFEYTGEPTSPPEIVGLSLVRDTGTPGDGTSFDPRITGTLADATVNGYSYTLEVDFDGDGQVDDQISVQAGTSFVYDPGYNGAVGAHTYSFRGVERTTVNGVDETATSDWVDFSFTRIAVPVVAPTLTNLHLINDTDGAGDGLTTDARLAVEVGSTETDGSVYYQIEIDLDGDGNGEQTFEAKPGEVFIFEPASVSLAPGEYTLKMRSTATDYTTYDESGWEEVSFEYVVPVSFDPRVNALRLENDTDLGHDRVTSDPRLTGFAVDGDRMGVSYTLEVDVDGDGDADFSQATTLGADFVVDPMSYIEYGKQSIGVRVVETLQGIGDDLAHAAKVTLSPSSPYTIRAAIGDESLTADQDVFRVDLLAGQTLTLDVDAKSVGGSPAFSGLDSYLKVLDALGVELASNGDELDEYGSPVGSDSKLSFTATVDGAYYIVLSADTTGSTATAGAYYLSLAVDSGSGTTSSATLPAVTHKSSAWSTVEFTYTPPSAATLPYGAQTDEDAPLTFTGGRAIVVHSVHSGEASVTLTVAHGVLALGGDDSGLASLSGDGSGTVVLSGTIGAINAALASSTFTPDADYFGTANFSLTVQELNPASGPGEHRTSEFEVEVRATNDAPTVSAPAALSTTEDAAVAFDASHRIVVADAESATGTLSVTLRAEHGSLHLGLPAAGLSTLQGDGSSTLTLIGTAVQVNASLESLVFTPEQDYCGVASVKVLVSDRGNFGAGGPLSAEGIVAVTISDVNDAPRIDAPSSATIDKNERLILEHFTSIVIQDVDSGTHSVSVTLSAAHGLLEALGDLDDLDSTTGDGTSALTLVGTLAAVNAALASVRYTPTTDFVGWDAIAVSVNDQGSGVTGATGAVGTDSVRIFVNEVWTAPTTDVDPPPAGPTAEEVQTQYDASMLALANAAKAAATAAQGILDSSLSAADVARAAALASAAASLQSALDAAQAVAVGSNTTALNALKAALGNNYDLLEPYLVADFAWPDQPAAPTISTSPVDVPSPQASGPSYDPTSSLVYQGLMATEKLILLQARFNLDLAYKGADSKAQEVRNKAMADADEAWSDAYGVVVSNYEAAMAEAGEILDALAGVQAHHDSQMNEASQTRNDAYHAAYETRADEQGEAWVDFWDRVSSGLDSEEYIHASYDLNVAINQAAAKYTKAMADADDAYARKSIETRRDLYVGLGEVDDAWVAAISSASLQLARDTAEIDQTRGESRAAAERIYDEKIAVAAHVRDTGLAEAAATYARDDLTLRQAAVATWAQAAGAPGSDARNWADYQKTLASVRTVAALEVVEASRVLSLGAVDAAKTRGLADAASHETQQRDAAAAAADRDVARAQAADQETQDRLEAQATHREQNADAQASRDEALASAVLDYTKGIADEQLTRDTTHAETGRDHLLADLAAWRRYEQNHDIEQYDDACDENSLRHLEKSAATDRDFRNAALDKGATLDDAVFSAVDGYREAVGANNSERRKADVEAIGVHVVGSATADADYAVAIADSIHNENAARAAHERDEANVVIGLQLTYANSAALTTSEAAVAAAEESQFYYDDVWDALVERLTPDPEAPPSPDAQYKLDLATAARDRVAAQGIALTDAATDAAEARLTRDLAVAAASAVMSYSLADDEYQRDVALSQATRDRVSAKATAPLAAAGGGGGAAAVKFMAAFAPERWVDSWWTDYIDRWWKRDAIYSELSSTMAEATRTRARTNSDAQYEYESLSITDEERVERGVEAQEAYDDTYSKAFKELQTRLAKFDLSTEAESSRAKGLRESGAAETRLEAATAMIAADRDWETASAQATLEYETQIADAQHVYSDAFTAAEDVVDRALAGIAKTQSNAFAAADSEAYLASEQADRTWTLTTWQQKESELGTSSGSDAALQEYQYKYAGAQVAWLIAKHQADSAYADATAETNLYLAQTSAAAAYDLAIVQIAAGTTRSYSNAVAAETSTVSDATATFERVRDDSISTYDYRVGVATLKTSHETSVQKAEAALIAAQREAQLTAALARIDAAKTLRDSNHSTEAQNAYDNSVSQANEQAEDEFRRAYIPYVAAVGAAYTAMIGGLGQKDVTWATEVATHQKNMVVDQNAAEAIYTAALRSSATIERDSLAPAESTYVAAVATAQRDAVMALANARNVQMRAMAPRDSGDPTLVAEPRLPSEAAGPGPTETFANAVAEAEADYHASRAHAAALTNPVNTFGRIVGIENEEVFGVLKSFYAYYAGVLAKADADFNRDEAAAEGKAAVTAANASLDQTLTTAAAGAVLSSAGWILDSALAVANEAADHALSEASAVADVDSVSSTAQARADYAAAIAKAQVKFNIAVAKLQIAEDQSGYEDAVDALAEGQAKAQGEAAVEQVVRLGAAAVKWVASAAQASTTQFTSLADAMTTHAVGAKAASLIYSTAVAAAEFTATVALGDAQATLWVDLARAAEKKDLAGRLADLEFQKEVATENAERVAEIVAQAGDYATSITAGTPLGTEFAAYNTYRIALAQAWQDWAEEAETEGQEKAETAAGARTTYAQTMADAYRTMVGFEASEVQTASVALATAQATEVLSLVQASAADLVRMAPLESKYRVDVAQAEKTYQTSMAKAALSESNRSTLEEAAGDARTEALKRLRDAYARDEQQAALTYAQSVASAQNTSAGSQAGIQKTRALTASAVLKDFTQTQKTAATTRVDTEADADLAAAKDRGYSWKSKTDALADDSAFPSPFAEYEAALADAGDRRIRTTMDAASDKLKNSVAADQLAVLNQRFAELDFAVKSTEKESDWLVDAVEKATTKNVGQVQAMGAKTASGEYDPDLLFSTPNSPIAANAGQAAANLGSGGGPSHGWNPGTYVWYYGDWGWYGWYNVGPWNEGVTSVSPDSGIAWTYGGSYGSGYDGYLGNWDPWYGDGWYGDVASASSYGEFSYSQLSSLTAAPGRVAVEATSYGLPATATDKPASMAEVPASTDVLGPDPGYGAVLVSMAADAERDLITGGAGSDVIEEAKAAAPPETAPFIGPLPAPPPTANVVAKEVLALNPAAGGLGAVGVPLSFGRRLGGVVYSGPPPSAELLAQLRRERESDTVKEWSRLAIMGQPVELWDEATERAISEYLTLAKLRGSAADQALAAEFAPLWREGIAAKQREARTIAANIRLVELIPEFAQQKRNSEMAAQYRIEQAERAAFYKEVLIRGGGALRVAGAVAGGTAAVFLIVSSGGAATPIVLGVLAVAVNADQANAGMETVINGVDHKSQLHGVAVVVVGKEYADWTEAGVTIAADGGVGLASWRIASLAAKAEAQLADDMARAAAKALDGQGGKLASAAPRGPFAGAVEGTAQRPKLTWTDNANGTVRSLEEAKEIARQNGVHIPEDIRFFPSDEWDRPDTYAIYGGGRDNETEFLWNFFYTRPPDMDGKEILPILFDAAILKSDEAIVAIFGHEMFELNKLREMFEKLGGTMLTATLKSHIKAGLPGVNLHTQAWDYADDLVRIMRGLPAERTWDIPRSEFGLFGRFPQRVYSMDD